MSLFNTFSAKVVEQSIPDCSIFTLVPRVGKIFTQLVLESVHVKTRIWCMDGGAVVQAEDDVQCQEENNEMNFNGKDGLDRAKMVPQMFRHLKIHCAPLSHFSRRRLLANEGLLITFYESMMISCP
ncbi:hypothetical protein HOLleu_02743 [Holothuria leucospilota]|uniref:Uncharacterized protein n=1 Tax=Holothuria leucospilota TaxID=206669 RepID=A0A9Q1HH93_HOLLE|nr:hypothetical protein HOLleu_02743 [Holothuria leucospilota]